jgi:hypothetical protein
MQLDWWDRQSHHFLTSHLEGEKHVVRISTGFFSIPGYDLLRQHLKDTKLLILVGYDERSKEQLAQKLLDELLSDLSMWQADRRETVLAVVQKLQANELTVMDARARNKDHAKVYIIDDRKVVVGSANFTKLGMTSNFEGNTVVTELEQVRYWVERFNHFWFAPDTVDISGELLARLLAWLELRQPWDVYLKAASVLLSAEPPETPVPNYRQPAEYQMVVIKRTLKQLEQHQGAIIVASTGLGKTVIATHIAHELIFKHGSTRQVLVIAPKAVTAEWEERLLSAGIAHRVFTSDLFDRKLKPGIRGETQRAVDTLKLLNKDWLLIIDESHSFKNRTTGGGKQRLSFERILEHVKRSGCKVLLLTATPFATEVDNINNQLLLLPHTNPDVGEMLPFHQHAKAWRVFEVKDLVDLEVATVFNTPYVAKNYGQHDDESNADYVLYPSGIKMYLPALHLMRVPVALPFADELIPLLNQRLFRHEWQAVLTRNGYRKRDDTVEEKVTISWASSPPELARALRNIAEDNHKVVFKSSQEERQLKLEPILKKLEAMTFEDDLKFMLVFKLVKESFERREKVVIFSERYATTGYLEQGLKHLLPQARVVSSVKRVDGVWEPKDHDKEVEPLIRGFAPEANKYEDGTVPEDKYDIFVTTDAYAEGVNLQDSSVLISYDIAWSADTIIQRAGRIMRFWPVPRRINLYCFTTDKKLNLHAGPVASRPSQRLTVLEQRLEQATHLTEINILPEEAETFARLGVLSKITLEDVGQVDLGLFEAPELSEVSSILEDLTQLNRHRAHATSLPDDISSAMVSSNVKTPVLISLVKVGGKDIILSYEPAKERVQELTEDVLFQLIRCEETTPVAPVDPAMIETLRNQAFSRWTQDTETATPVQHICTVYLLPISTETNLWMPSLSLK